MSYGWCDNPREHKREGERDFERHGRYGYDTEKYHDHWNDCNKAYQDGFNEARREQERREERRDEELREQQREDRRARECRAEIREQEEIYEQQQREQEPDYEAMERACYHGQALKFCHDHQMTRRERIKWMRRQGYPLNFTG